VTSSSSPRERILAALAELPPKQRRLARFFLDHEDQLIYASANDISEQVGASAATVVRFCQALGYEGYADLQAAIRAQLPQYRTGVQKLAERIANGGFADNLSVQVAQVNTNNVQYTMSQVSETDLAAAAAAILRARQIRIFGSGLSAAAAVFAEHALTVLGYPVRACTNGGLIHALEISHLTDQDLVIVISLWRYLRDTVEAAEAAHARDIPCIALTDSLAAPAARLADYVFIAATEGATHSRSLTGILSLIELLGAAIVAKQPVESMAALQQVDNLYHQKGLLLSD
jgi:DNA-binding MurR/RpiR family transcriptional regulator